MTKQSRNSPRLCVALSLAVVTATLAPAMAFAGQPVKYGETTSMPVQDEMPNNREMPDSDDMMNDDEMPGMTHSPLTSQTPVTNPSSTTSPTPVTSQMPMHGMSHTGDVDHDFAANMRHHHEMGVAMAQAQIKDGQDPEMTRVARDFLTAQQAEIVVLDRWLASEKVDAPDAE